MSNESRLVPVEQISGWIRDAAIDEAVVAEKSAVALSSSHPPPAAASLHAARIRASLHRARTKTFVRMVKPFRRLFRNQGAVNDSLIEALHHVAAQNEEMMQQVNDLRGVVHGLRAELRRAPAPVALSVPAEGEAADRIG